MTAPVSHTTNTKPARHAGGFTLAEALIASVVLAISAMAIANSMAACDKSQEWLQQSVNCQGLAKQLVEEISSRSFSVEPNPGYSTGHTNRALYDDVADYNGYTDNSASSAGITTLSGTKISFNDGATTRAHCIVSVSHHARRLRRRQRRFWNDHRHRQQQRRSERHAPAAGGE